MVDRYLDGAPAPQRETLGDLRATLGSVLPHGVEMMKYGMPAITLDGVGVAGYGAFRDHCSYFPMSGAVIEAAGERLSGYRTSKGAIQFGVDERLPVGLVRHLVRLRLAEIADVEDGRRREYHSDGRLKAVGAMRGGAMHGAWEWFRKDGTLMRTGRFTEGNRVGTWTTWDREGTVVKVTEY